MSPPKPSSDLKRRLAALLDAGILSSPAPMDSLARALDLSTRTLRRRLAEQHTTCSDIIATWRIDTAKQLLRQTELPIRSIAMHLGYRHASNFERAFKRWTRLTPRTYRNRQVDDTGP